MTLTVGRACSAPQLVAAAVFALMPLLVPAAVMAAPITWGGAQDIQGDGDVSTNGTLVYAYNLGTHAGGTTIGGVQFAPTNLPAGSDSQSQASFGNGLSISESEGILVGDLDFSSGFGRFNSLSSGYKDLLRTGVVGDHSATLTLTLFGLNQGQTYAFQWWSNNSSGNPLVDQTEFFDLDPNSNTLILDAEVFDPGPPSGALGQWAIGVFTADSGTQIIDFNSLGTSTFPLINGFQLRQVQASVPAPTAGLLALGGLALVLLWRRQRPV